jgi:hypothetical protein
MRGNIFFEWNVKATNRRKCGTREEDRQWQRLRAGEPAGRQPALANAYMDAVERADQADFEVLEPAGAVDHEQAIGGWATNLRWPSKKRDSDVYASIGAIRDKRG